VRTKKREEREERAIPDLKNLNKCCTNQKAACYHVSLATCMIRIKQAFLGREKREGRRERERGEKREREREREEASVNIWFYRCRDRLDVVNDITSKKIVRKLHRTGSRVDWAHTQHDAAVL